MFPFWEVAIAPVLQAAEARRIVEIGAFRGEHTEILITTLGPETVLHVIDPVPDFDPEEQRRRFAGQYVFHRALSRDVLGELPVMDAALVDGDHNWYTVITELRLLAQVARAADAPLPVLVLHDVAWPYGRRDLYYDPSNIPAEHRQPYERAGMRPGQSELAGRGGLSPNHDNATHEGGPRNGVMTALEDFVAEHDRPMRVVTLPIYFGLAIAVEEERLARQPEVAAALDRLESAEGRLELMELGEEIRLRNMLLQHSFLTQRDSARAEARRLASRYLGTVKAALLDEHYLDNESRLAHLTSRIAAGRAPEARILRDPVRHDTETWGRISRQRAGAGEPGSGPGSFVPYTNMGRVRLDDLEARLDRLRADGVGGDLVECGTGRGGGSIFLRAWADAHGVGNRTVWVVDRFRASPDGEKLPSLPDDGVAGFRADLNLVREGFERFGLLDGRVRFLQGDPAAALADDPIAKVALLRIGRGLSADDARAALERLYPRVAVGGTVLVDAGVGSPALTAIEKVRAEWGIAEPVEEVVAGVVVWTKTAEATAPPATRRRGTRVERAVRRRLGRPVPARPAEATTPDVRVRVPVAPRTVDPTETVDLTVVVVFYDMKREAQRTLRSLSRGYQQGIDDLTYEVVAVENGSPPEGRLTAAEVEAFGPEFRLLDLGEEAEPSPVLALNRGIQEGRGRAFALMIDGAHVLTPGVLRYAMAGLEAYAPAIVATQQWYTGPGQQGDAMDGGYDQDDEDRLFASIDWPHAGHRLFEIGHFVGDRDWLDGVWESNCMFATRELLAQSGCFDESFSMAGGGYANLELYERLGSSPDTTVVSILGEGSFHQLHGGTTTNQPDPVERRSRVFGYSQHYAELRGRAFKGPGKPIHYVGRFHTPAARRTKPRRLSGAAFADAAAPGTLDGPPAEPTPVPQELKVSFTDAVWRNMPWRSTRWLGRPVASAPTDLIAYQELVARVRPDWIVEVGPGDGGRSLFLASVCDLVGHGQVVSVGDGDGSLPSHPRLHHVAGRPHDDDVVAAVRGLVGAAPHALVLLGARADQPTTVRQFEAYAPMVRPGSYVVVTDTVVNGHPVWTGFGNGPAEAVKQILTRHGQFVPDPSVERWSFTLDPGGYLLRTE